MGRGGKSLFYKQAFECVVDGRLVEFDREQIVATLLKDNLPGRFILGVDGVGDRDLAE